MSIQVSYKPQPQRQFVSRESVLRMQPKVCQAFEAIYVRVLLALLAWLGFLYANCQSKTAASAAAANATMLISPDFGSLCTGRAQVMAPLWSTRNSSS